MQTLIRLVALLALASASEAYAKTLSDELPTGEQVVKDVQGSDRTDVVARQLATLSVLTVSLYNVEGMAPNDMSATGRERLQSYERVRQQILENFFDPKCMTIECPYYVATMRSAELSVNESFQKEVWNRYLSADARAPLEGILPSNLANTIAQEQSAQERKISVMAFAVGLVWLVLFVILVKHRVRGTVDMGKTKPGVLIVGTREYTINGATGEAHSPNVTVTNRVSIQGTQGNQQVRNREVRHVEFFIRTAAGGDQDVRLENVDIAVAEGHKVSTGWVIEKGQERGPYLFFRNHSTGNTAIVNGTVSDMVELRGLPWLLILISLPLFLVPLAVHWVIAKSVELGRAKQIVEHIHTRWVPQCDAQAGPLASVSRAS